MLTCNACIQFLLPFLDASLDMSNNDLKEMKAEIACTFDSLMCQRIRIGNPSAYRLVTGVVAITSVSFLVSSVHQSCDGQCIGAANHGTAVEESNRKRFVSVCACVCVWGRGAAVVPVMKFANA